MLQANRNRQLLWALGLVAVLLTIASVAYHLRSEYQLAISRAENATQMSAVRLQQGAQRIFGQLRILFSGLDDLIESTDTGPHWEHDQAIRELLIKHQRLNPYLMDLLVLDERLRIVHWTGSGKMPDVADRDYARAHREIHSPELFVGKPLLSRVHEGRWFFGVSHADRDTFGRLRHVLVAIIDMAYINDLLRSIPRSENGTALLADLDGVIYSRVPGGADFSGQSIPGFKELAENSVDLGTLIMESPLDGRQRLISYQRFNQFPLVAITSADMPTTLSNWRRNLWPIIAAALVIIGVLGGLIGVLHRQQREQSRLLEELEHLATHDELTGLANRRHFFTQAQRELQRASRYQQPCVAIMLDIDHFKRVNDTRGHKAGDLALARIADLMRDHSRAIDLSCRYGGEEFAFLLPETDIEGGRQMAENLRQHIAETVIDYAGRPFRVTASLGVAEFRRGEPLDQLLNRADTALYQAKRTGRNRVIVSDVLELDKSSSD